MDVMVERCAGLDVHRDNVVATVRVPGSARRRWAQQTRTFRSTLAKILKLNRLDPAKSECRGILAAQSLKPQAVTLAESRGLRCVEVDLAVLRGEREPELTLFG